MIPQQAPSIGLVPFYLKLYDDLRPATRADFDGYLRRIEAGFAARGIVTKTAGVCRVAAEFAEAVRGFEKAGVDALVTLHLAYSPSLESIEAFVGTRLPILILDATMDADFGRDVGADRIMYNHGIHGVMDFASMLRRRRRAFEIVAGHDGDPRTLDRASDLVRAARAARDLHGSKVLRVGEAFYGMGDFSVPQGLLASKLGVESHQVSLNELDAAILEVKEGAVAEELASDRKLYACELAEEAHLRSIRVGLGLRSLLERGGYGGFSVNFQAFDRGDRPSDTMPFLEISKAMARGIGYGGEGDVLTASMVGALARAFGSTTFTEIFCPDWKGDSLFLSHMGEISPAVAGDRPRIVSKPFFGGGSKDPAVLTCAVKPGKAVFVNLAPGPDDSFTLIVAPVEVLPEEGRTEKAMRDSVRAWVKPPGGISRFLEAYSRLGGTHHSALVLGDRAEAVAAFGRMAGFDVALVDGGSS